MGEGQSKEVSKLTSETTSKKKKMAKKLTDKYYLECTTGSHNKFYEVKCYLEEGETPKWHVETCHGVIGTTKLRTGVRKTFHSQSLAAGFARSIIHKKLAKGYVDKTGKKTIRRPQRKLNKNSSTDASLRRFAAILSE